MHVCKYAAPLLLTLLAGCATVEQDYSATRNSWQGASYDAVLAQWGQPQRYTVADDGRYVYTWFSQTGAGSGGGGLNSSIGVFGGSGGMGIGVGTGIALGQGGGDYMRCERTLYFKEGRVVEQNWLGPSRYCSLFRRNPG
jgi:hypothetical protein